MGGEVDLRQLRYFVAVAEEGTFTRAAERLLMTQPALSRTIQSLEAAVGTPLLVRGYREVSLTAAGRVLLHQARNLEDQAMAAIRMARRTGTSPPELRVTAHACDVVVLDRLVTSYNRAEPRVPALALPVNHAEQTDQLRDGRADIGLVRVPFDDRGLEGEELLSEPRVALLSDRHPLAVRGAVELAQLTDLPVLRLESEQEGAVLAWPPDIPGRRWVEGTSIADTAQLHALARLGRGVAFLPQSMASAGPFAGVRAVRVIDAPPSTLRIAWAAASTSRPIAEFVRRALSAVGSGSPPDLAPPVRVAAR
jgi:DNA-binding transcriptional LysR family regulator